MKLNYSVKPNAQSQACLSYVMAKNSLMKLNYFVRQLILQQVKV
ncbi:hypothetical protein SAMN05216357_104123 [Porphyromonadaceae bacterium KH3CP3RA]|nr:hypothetical protein SAMN05216357_104123 [Porphyromonadaceae bacterium KH3CP3RA]